jgi:hypothetical protein
LVDFTLQVHPSYINSKQTTCHQTEKSYGANRFVFSGLLTLVHNAAVLYKYGVRDGGTGRRHHIGVYPKLALGKVETIGL